MTADRAHSPTSLRSRGGRMDRHSQATVGGRRLATARGWVATSPWSPRLAVAALVAVMVGAAVLAYLPFTQTPSPQPASAPAAVFSADRALVELRAVAAEPRPMGSIEHETAIVAIRDRLTELGVESDVVEGVASRNDFNQVFAGRLRNVIARIPGTDSTGSVLLLSHFDSVPTSMNANDGGLGVATVLETVRALQAGPPPVNDVVLWFGDADETTGLNALLLQDHRWFRDVRFGFAFEAPGATGPSLLTFTGQGNPEADPPLLSLGDNEGVSLDNTAISTDNGRWLREALEAVPHPVVALPLNDIALGASPDLGMSMWGTDLAGVSFSQIANSSGYHTDLDRPDRVSRSSLQDSGDTALALARHFGRFDFTDAPDAGGLVAFTIPSGRIVSYPTAWAVPLALLTLTALAAVLIVAKRRRQLTVTGLLVGVATTVIAVVASVVIAVVATGLPAPDAHFARNPYGIGWRILLLAAITLAVVAAVFAGASRLLKRPARVTAIAAGPVIVVSVLALVTGAAAPALSYVFLWPAVAGGALMAWQVLRPDTASRPWPAAGALALVAVVVASVGVPLVYLLASAASVSLPMFAAVIAVFIALVASVLVPHFRYLSGRRGWVTPAALAVVAAACFAGLQLTAGYSADRPRPNYIQYTLDADTGQATWMAAGTDTDRWTAQFFPDGYTSTRQAFSPGYYFDQDFDVIESPAPPVDVDPPQISVLGDTAVDGVRTLQLQITSPRGAPMAHLDLTLPGDLVAATVGGEPVTIDDQAALRRFPLAAYNLGEDGIELTISLRSAEPVTGTLTDYSNGLPAIEGLTVSPRPAEFMPAPFDFRDPTAVRTSVEL